MPPAIGERLIGEVRTDIPPPPRSGPKARVVDWSQVPVGGSFEYIGSKQAVVQSFAAHLAAGKYQIAAVGPDRYRFWRLG